MKGIQAEIYLLIIVIIWGSTFALIKGVIELIPPYTYLTYRFLLAVLILVVRFVCSFGPYYFPFFYQRKN